MKELTFAVIIIIVVFLVIAMPFISIAGAVGGLVAIFALRSSSMVFSV